VTECSPVIAVNTPMHFKAGTVGRLLPLIEHRLEPVPGIAEGGKLLLRGPNIMSGYLRPEAPGALAPPDDGWHDTGDIVRIDDEGFVTIAGRAKRFAKLAGEMVSLAVAERIAMAAYPEHRHAVVALPDSRRGERLVLVSEAPSNSSGGVMRDALVDAAHREGLPEIAIPRDVIAVAALPLLGSGKTDYAAVSRLAADANGAPLGGAGGDELSSLAAS
jgi:acyl-[acyl-carrier-protein]-phospholipid O-acyltransferase / long-chain-fatty-acid--[acyl-carrier-protein] ligase